MYQGEPKFDSEPFTVNGVGRITLPTILLPTCRS